LAIGSETDLVIIDININQILHVLGSITSILWTNHAQFRNIQNVNIGTESVVYRLSI
uniref:Uncharacterized protein n=1 Tax=Amphimedon queenslandica TaxID=400682 RepID=A0A1X7SI80_AMPQE